MSYSIRSIGVNLSRKKKCFSRVFAHKHSGIHMTYIICEFCVINEQCVIDISICEVDLRYLISVLCRPRAKILLIALYINTELFRL